MPAPPTYKYTPTGYGGDAENNSAHFDPDPGSILGVPGAHGSSLIGKGYVDNASAYQYGGSPTGAKEASDYYKGLGGAVHDQMKGAARGLMDGSAVAMDPRATAMLQAQAAGTAPSAAQVQTRQSMQGSIAAQQAQAAGARGAGAMGMSQMGQAGGTAMQQGQLAAQGAQMRQAEQLAGQKAFGAQVGAQAQLNTQAQGLGLNAMYLGNKSQAGYENIAQGITTQQLQDYIAQQKQRENDFNAAHGLAIQQGNANRAFGNQVTGGLLGFGTGVASSLV